MRKMISFSIVLLAGLSGGYAAAEDAPSPSLTAEEHAELIRLLDESFDKLMGLITGLSDEQWNFKQNPDRWSTGECAEHIVRSETALLDAAMRALSGDPDPEWQERTKGKTALLRQIMPNRGAMGAGGATAPMEIRPSEKWGRGKAIAEFYKIRGEVRGYAETLDETGRSGGRPIKEYTEEHPFPVFGWLSAHDWLLYIPLHTIRHSKQIIEVQEDENFPEG